MVYYLPSFQGKVWVRLEFSSGSIWAQTSELKFARKKIQSSGLACRGSLNSNELNWAKIWARIQFVSNFFSSTRSICSHVWQNKKRKNTKIQITPNNLRPKQIGSVAGDPTYQKGIRNLQYFGMIGRIWTKQRRGATCRRRRGEAM